MTKKEKADLIKRILNMELDMFLAVRSVEPAKCQENPDAFRLVRGSGFESWSYDALTSYLEDLTRAQKEGKNLMTLKYARMSNQIPCLNHNPLINKIVNIETELQQQFKEKYPHLVRNIGAGIYLRSELETYSDKTLELYYTNLLRARKAGRNLVEETYLSIFKELGYSSLEEVEEQKHSQT